MKKIIADHLAGAEGRAKVDRWVPQWLAVPPAAYTPRGGVAAVRAHRKALAAQEEAAEAANARAAAAEAEDVTAPDAGADAPEADPAETREDGAVDSDGSETDERLAA